jgi:hypothetical protein
MTTAKVFRKQSFGALSGRTPCQAKGELDQISDVLPTLGTFQETPKTLELGLEVFVEISK